MITGLAEFADTPRIISAPMNFWRSYGMSHLDKIVKKIVDATDDLRCLICGYEYSLNYKTKASLFHHYKNHKHETVDYYLKNLLEKTEECKIQSNQGVMTQ